MSATRERPLFEPSRRPPPASTDGTDVGAAPAAALAPARPELELRGVILGRDRQVAIVSRPQDAHPVRLQVGSAIDGWIVEEIRARDVVLRRDDRTVTVEMTTPAR